MKKYTIQEIDALRELISNKFLYGRYDGPEFFDVGGVAMQTAWSRSYKESELSAHVEDRVRTFMVAGIKPADLTKDANQ